LLPSPTLAGHADARGGETTREVLVGLSADVPFAESAPADRVGDVLQFLFPGDCDQW
jgi:hypothetical protein